MALGYVDGALWALLDKSAGAVSALSPVRGWLAAMFPPGGDNFTALHLLTHAVPLAVCIKLLRMLLCWAVFDRLAARCNFASPMRARKFAEQMWFMVLYSAFVVMALVVLPGESFWGHGLDHLWAHHAEPLSGALRGYYMVEIGFYFAALFDHVLIDARRNDFMAMLVHHVATILLMTMSYYNGNARIGALIVALHDVADVFVSLTKTTHYLNWGAASIACFAMLLISWAATRLYALPVHLLHSAWVHPDAYGIPIRIHGFFLTLLAVLFALHVYWFYLFLRMAATMLVQGEACDDVRSDSEDEEYETVKKKAL
jgi:hypothetical protein